MSKLFAFIDRTLIKLLSKNPIRRFTYVCVCVGSDVCLLQWGENLFSFLFDLLIKVCFCSHQVVQLFFIFLYSLCIEYMHGHIHGKIRRKGRRYFFVIPILDDSLERRPSHGRRHQEESIWSQTERQTMKNAVDEDLLMGRLCFLCPIETMLLTQCHAHRRERRARGQEKSLPLHFHPNQERKLFHRLSWLGR